MASLIRINRLTELASTILEELGIRKFGNKNTSRSGWTPENLKEL